MGCRRPLRDRGGGRLALRLPRIHPGQATTLTRGGQLSASLAWSRGRVIGSAVVQITSEFP
jgi:hypothetical protein